MTASLTFYTHPMSRGRTVRWMLEECGATYETVPLEYGSTMKAPEYLAINPMGKVPAIVHDGLVIVAPDEGGRPGRPRAFLTTGAQGINLHRGTWHGVLTPLSAPGLFAVVDRIGAGANLEEYRYDAPWRVVRDDPA